MKIYFAGSIRGGRDEEENYLKIIKHLAPQGQKGGPPPPIGQIPSGKNNKSQQNHERARSDFKRLMHHQLFSAGGLRS